MWGDRGWTGQSQGKMKPMHPAGQGITVLLLERVSEKKNVVSHRALFITVPLTFHPEKMSFYCVIPLFPKFILKPSFSHSLWVWEAHASHPRLAARPQSTSDVQPPHQSILSHSCLEHRDVRCMFCFTHLFWWCWHEEENKGLINNSLQSPGIMTVRALGHKQPGQHAAPSPAPFTDSNNASFPVHTWICSYNPT